MMVLVDYQNQTRIGWFDWKHIPSRIIIDRVCLAQKLDARLDNFEVTRLSQALDILTTSNYSQKIIVLFASTYSSSVPTLIVGKKEME